MKDTVAEKLARLGIPLAVLCECLLFGYLSATFWTPSNLLNVALQVSVTGILAVGMTLVILTGGIDLSVGSLVAVSGISAAMIAQSGFGGVAGSLWIGLMAACAIGLWVGDLTGRIITRFDIPPFIATLAMMTMLRGAAFLLTRGYAIGNLPPQFGWLGRARLFEIPLPAILMVLAFGAGYLLLSRTVLGRNIYGVGGNERAVWLSGVDTRRIKVQVYAINGFLGGFAGLLLASRLGAGVPNAGLQYELDVIAAVVVGGTSLTGGKGDIRMTFLGALFIGILNNGLNLTGVDPYTQKIVLGVVILLAVLADRYLSRMRVKPKTLA